MATLDLCALSPCVDWRASTIGGVGFERCAKLDFRSAEGRQCKGRCPSVPSASALKRIGRALPRAAAALQRLNGHVRGWWVRLQIREKGVAYYTRWRVVNNQDPVTLETLDDLPSPFWLAVGHCAYDVRQLCHLVRNPFDNVPFDDATRARVARRWERLRTRLRYDESGSGDAAPPPTTLQRALHLFQCIDQLDYITDISWFDSLDEPQLRQWYRSAEDIWNYRAELPPDAQQRIAPGLGHTLLAVNKHTVRQETRLEALRVHVLDAMEALVTTAADRADRVLGAMYVLAALTECCMATRSALPWLHQPP